MSDKTKGRKVLISWSRALVALSLLIFLGAFGLAATGVLAGRLTDTGGSRHAQVSGPRTLAPDTRIAPTIPDRERPSRPRAVDAFAFFQPGVNGTCAAPSNGGNVLVGCTFVLDLFINSGTNAPPDGPTAAQNYLTYTHQFIQNARVSTITSGCTITSTAMGDLSTFDAVLQNEICNGPGNCVFRGLTVGPGSFAFASGALTNCPEGCEGVFRVAQTGWCASASGQAVMHWEFAPPAPPTRDTEIVSFLGNLINNPALYTDYTFTITGGATNTPVPTNTATNTTAPTNTATSTAVPTDTATDTPVPTNTATNTAVPTDTPTNTAIPTNTATNTVVPTNTPTDTTVPTNTPVPTDTPTDTPVPTDTATNTVVPTDTPASTDTPTPTDTPAPIDTPAPTDTATSTAVPTDTPTDTPVVPTNSPTITRTPTPVRDAFMLLEPEPGGPPNGGIVTVGDRFVLDLLLDAGSYNPPDGATAHQSYMTFTYDLLQNARVSDIGTSCNLTGTVTADQTVFDAVLQNEVCNGPGQCDFRGLLVDPGTLAFASGALSNCPEGCGGVFRVAQVGLCAVAPGRAVMHWEFTPPAPPIRDTAIVSYRGELIHNPALFTDYVINIVGATVTPTNTPTDTPVPTITNTPTVTDTPTDTPVSTDTATPSNTPSDTPTDTPVPTDTATDTPVPTDTDTATPIPTLTDTPVPTDTATDTPVLKVTNTPVPTDTATDTPVPTDTATDTPVALTDTPTETPVPTGTPTITLTPTRVRDAFMLLVPEPGGPPNGGIVTVGDRFVLDLLLDAGSYNPPNGATAQQSYMTFTYQLLQNARVSDIGTSCNLTSTITPDQTVFDAVLQNEVCNGPGQCNFRGLPIDPGSFAYASGALSNCPEGCGGVFRVAQVGLCAIAPGQALLHWQFTPPAPPTRDTAIVDFRGELIHNPALFTDYVINIVGATVTPTPTITSTPAVTDTPTDTPTNTLTPAPTSTRVSTPVATDTPTPTITLTQAPSITPTPSITLTRTPSITPTPSITLTRTPSITPTPSITLTPSPSITPTPTRTFTWTPSPTLTPTRTFTWTPSPTLTLTRTPSFTPTLTNTPTNTQAPSITPTPTITQARSITPTPIVTSTPPTNTPTITVTPCAMNFSDVHPSEYFYVAVRYLYCQGAISGYDDGTFRPFNNTTRGQLCKIVVLARHWPIDTTGAPHFSDVPPGHPFYVYIETAYNRQIISGYADGTFHPYDDVTRGQICKIVVLAMDWPPNCPPPGHFSDVPPSHPFFCYIETAYHHQIISGYDDGTFRPYDSATRGQVCKIVYGAVTQLEGHSRHK